MLNYLYKKWLLNSQNIVILVLIVFIKRIIIDKVYDVYAITNSPFCIFEPPIMVMNSGLIVLLLSIFFIFIMSDYPSSDSNLYYQMIRSGRRRWFFAQAGFGLLAIVTYIGFIMLFLIVCTQQLCFVANGWSLNISNFADRTHLESYIQVELFNQMPPVKAFVLSLLLLFGYFYLLLGIQIAGFSFGKQRQTGYLQFIILFSGMCLVFFKNKFMWLLPQAHSILFIHFSKYFKKPIFPPDISIILFFAIGTVLYIISYINIMHRNIDSFRENIL